MLPKQSVPKDLRPFGQRSKILTIAKNFDAVNQNIAFRAAYDATVSIIVEKTNLMKLIVSFFLFVNYTLKPRYNDPFCSLHRIIHYIKCNMHCKSSKWELGYLLLTISGNSLNQGSLYPRYIKVCAKIFQGPLLL